MAANTAAEKVKNEVETEKDFQRALTTQRAKYQSRMTAARKEIEYGIQTFFFCH